MWFCRLSFPFSHQSINSFCRRVREHHLAGAIETFRSTIESTERPAARHLPHGCLRFPAQLGCAQAVGACNVRASLVHTRPRVQGHPFFSSSSTLVTQRSPCSHLWHLARSQVARCKAFVRIRAVDPSHSFPRPIYPGLLGKRPVRSEGSSPTERFSQWKYHRTLLLPACRRMNCLSLRARQARRSIRRYTRPFETTQQQYPPNRISNSNNSV